MTLPEGWRETSLSSVVLARSGNSSIIKGRNSATPSPGLIQGYSASGPDVWVEEAEHHGPGVVVSAVGARCGKAFLADGDWAAIANTHVLIPKPCLDPKFLWYLVNDEHFWVRSGSAQPFLKVKASLARAISLPPLIEQRRIVEILEEHLSRLYAAESYLLTATTRNANFILASLANLLTSPDSRETRFSDILIPAAAPRGHVDVRTAGSEGRWPVVDQGGGSAAVRSDDEDAVYHGPFPVIAFGDHTRRFKKLDEEFAIGGTGVKLLLPADGVSAEFAYWALRNTRLRARGYGRHFALLRASTLRIGDAQFQSSVVTAMNEVTDAHSRVNEGIRAQQSRSGALRRALLHAAFSGQLTGRPDDLDRAEEFVSA
ncbi:restriction endonuclease subunit S [uncultured Amnibacterium sp.]|uniref:restriction endonuclease subunit S n=1 Tax=uncultured Amnibacterium sp. TaxID=1631851 RepID=UPI0035CBCB59